MSIEDLERLANRMSANSVSIGDWETLIHYAEDKELVVELGTNIGSTALILSYFAKKVHTIDIFEQLDFIEDIPQREMYRSHWESNKHTFESITAKLKPYSNITVHQDLSYKAAEYFKDNSVDLVFIDADHSYKGVKKDYEAWFSKVKVGGYFAFHDVGPGCPVFDFYNKELIKDYKLDHQYDMAMGPCWTQVFRKI